MIYSAIPFLDKLTPQQRSDFDAGLHQIHYSAGQMIHLGSEDCVGLLYVERGSIRVYITSEEGREVTLFRIEDGDVCVLSASCVLEAVDFEVNIEAVSETDVQSLDVATFSRLARENVYVELFSYKVATERFSDVMWAMQQILFTSFDRRLATFLLEECAKQHLDGATGKSIAGSGTSEDASLGTEVSENNTLVMTHDQIAKYIGSAREVVSRMLKYFEKEGWVKLGKGKITILQCDTLRKI